jgi:hypothetical protein
MAQALALLLALASPSSAAPDYSALYGKGVAFAPFVEYAERLKHEWEEKYAHAKIDEASIARAKALKGTWRLLVVAEDRCHDSLETVPYLAKLAEASPDTLALRIVSKREGAAVIEAHRTPDGRGATPTIVVLDAEGAVKGTLVERPAALWEFSKTHDSRNARLDWYREDQGRHAVAEILDIIESQPR